MGSGRGKRGGIRGIYYMVCQGEIFMLYAYQMNREVDLIPRHLPMLRELVEQHLQTPTRMILHCFVRASAKRVRFGVVLRRSGR